MRFRKGDIIAEKYRVIDLLGEGGMGAVLLAHHELLNRPVAVKVMHSAFADPAQRERFLREGRIMAQVSSPHAVRLNDVGQLPSGEVFLVMERLEGKDLQTTIERDGPLPVALAVDVVLQALDALAEAHSLGIIHRDLKPANIFLTTDANGRMLAKVLDFGISKATKEDVALTSTGAVMGSPLYMAPEQVRSAKSAHVGTDIWALGVVLFESLMGEPPFNGNTAGEVFAQIIDGQIPWMEQKRPDLPPRLVEIVTRCLAKRMPERFASCGALAQALAPFGTGQCNGNVTRALGFTPSLSSQPTSNPALSLAPPSSGHALAAASGAHAITNLGTQQTWADMSNAAPRPPLEDARPSKLTPLAIGITAFAIGLLLMVLAARRWHKEPPPLQADEPPGAASDLSVTTAATAPTAPTPTIPPAMTASGPRVPAAVPHPSHSSGGGHRGVGETSLTRD